MISETFDPATGFPGLGDFEVRFRAGTDMRILGEHVDPVAGDTAGGAQQNIAHDLLVVTRGLVVAPTRASVLADALYVGEILVPELDDQGGEWSISGKSALNFLGDDDQKSPSIGGPTDYTTTSPLATTSLATYIAYAESGGWTGGIATDTAGVTDSSFLGCAARTWDSMRTIFEQLCSVTSPRVEFWLNPTDLTLYFADNDDTSDAVYQWNPKVMFASGIAESWENGIRAPWCRIKGRFDYGPEANAYHATTSDGTTGTISSGGGNRFNNDITGTGTYTRAKFLGASDELIDQLTHGGGAAQLETIYCRRDTLEITTDDEHLRRDVKPGDWVYVYSPRLGLRDTTNQFTFHGRTVMPAKRRVSRIDWPVAPPRGVYLIRSNSAYGGANAVTNVTNEIIPDRRAPKVTISSGAPERLRSALLGSQWRPRWDKA